MRISISSFNAGLVETGRRLMIREYLTELNHAVFREDISLFANDLLDLVQKDECCIPHEKLVSYGVLANKNLGSDVLRMFEQYELVEGADYIILAPGKNEGPGRPRKWAGR